MYNTPIIKKKKNTVYTLESFLFCFVFKNKQTILRSKTSNREDCRVDQAEQIHNTANNTYELRTQRESKVDTEILRESQRRRRTYLYGELMKQYPPNIVRPVSYSCRDSRAQISPGLLSRNRKSTHKALAPRIDSKSPLFDETKGLGQFTGIQNREERPTNQTHNPETYAYADHNRKSQPDPQPNPQSEITTTTQTHNQTHAENREKRVNKRGKKKPMKDIDQ